MIIARHISTVKEGRQEEFVEYAKWWNKRFPPPHAPRLYLPSKGAPSNVIVEDVEFESMEEWRSHVNKVHSDPDFASAIAKRQELQDDAQHELWQVIELE